MKYLAIGLWLLVGVGYYYLWDSHQKAILNPKTPIQEKQEISVQPREKIQLSEEAQKSILKAAESATQSEEIVVVEEYEIGFLYFPYNSDKPVFSTDSETYLKKKVDQAQKQDMSIMVIGHADNLGEEEYNYDLGMRRAMEIKNKLVSLGFPEGKIKAESRGEKEPVATNDTDQGRSANRRVEIYLQ